MQWWGVEGGQAVPQLHHGTHCSRKRKSTGRAIDPLEGLAGCHDHCLLQPDVCRLAVSGHGDYHT